MKTLPVLRGCYPQNQHYQTKRIVGSQNKIYYAKILNHHKRLSKSAFHFHTSYRFDAILTLCTRKLWLYPTAIETASVAFMTVSLRMNDRGCIKCDVQHTECIKSWGGLFTYIIFTRPLYASHNIHAYSFSPCFLYSFIYIHVYILIYLLNFINCFFFGGVGLARYVWESALKDKDDFWSCDCIVKESNLKSLVI